ncbi:hypothetical protein [Streptomyces sp. NBC_01363]|uniref:hypothetical protein n=1 Tax=Streptomyces sp. NBC_01363 TaxID=2903840 RepID=UPI0022520ACF|nr:hypothetical protein [Streptomyces sp. NBC_01363]MCX4734633.1 hypothetical protein [Streptomyces sp. NBC_01363]
MDQACGAQHVADGVVPGVIVLQFLAESVEGGGGLFCLGGGRRPLLLGLGEELGQNVVLGEESADLGLGVERVWVDGAFDAVLGVAALLAPLFGVELGLHEGEDTGVVRLQTRQCRDERGPLGVVAVCEQVRASGDPREVGSGPLGGSTLLETFRKP